MIGPDVPLSYLKFGAAITNTPLYIIIILLMILISAFCSGTEAAYSYCNRYKIKVWADDGKRSAKVALRVLEKMDKTIIAILIVNNIVNNVASILATVLTIALIGDLGGIVSTIVLTILVFIFGEVLPKNIAKANCDKWVVTVSVIIETIIFIFMPFIWFFNGMVRFVKKIFRVKETSDDEFNEDDFQDTVEKISDEGVIGEEESEIIIAAVDWGDTRVSEVLTKRKDIVALNIHNCNEEELNEFIINNYYSRIPVYEKNINNIIGILHVRKYLKELFVNKKVNIRDILIKPYFVDPKIKLDDIFEGFKEHHTHMAIVQNKGQTIGMVTMKDILEELVSDIDEADTSSVEGGANNA